MKKAKKRNPAKKKNGPIHSDDEMRPEYDFSGGTRGKYAKRVAEDAHVVLLEPDLAAEFPDSRAVSRALRAYLEAKKSSTPEGRTPGSD